MGRTWIQLKRLIKASVPAVVIIGSVPQFLLIWGTWKALSLIFLLPDDKYQRGDDVAFSLYQRLILFFFEHTTGVEIYLHGDVEKVLEKKENVLYISNHQCTMDWMVADMLAIRQGSLGHLRFIMKESLQLLPHYGHYFYQHGCIFVKRGNFNEKKMLNDLKYLNNKAIQSWIVLFPEGTRYDPENKILLDKNAKLAHDKDHKPFQHLLWPKPKGMQLILSQLSDNLDSVYDATIAYANTYDVTNRKRLCSPSIVDFLSNISPEVHIHVKKIPIESIPYRDDNAFKIWLQNLFEEKDRIMNDLLKNDKDVTIENAKLSHLPLRETASSLLLFSTISIPFLFTSTGRSLYWKTWVFGTFLCYSWLGIRSRNLWH